MLLLVLAGLAGAAEPPAPVAAPAEGGATGAPAPAPEEGGIDWALFSDRGRAFRPLLADQREAQVRMGFLQDTGDERSFLDLAFGGGADTWLRLQAAHDLAQARRTAKDRIKVKRYVVRPGVSHHEAHA